MKLAPPLATGRLVRRYKRFLADVETDAGVLTMHCPNTGAMTGCADPGSEVWFSTTREARRKYPHTLEVVCTGDARIGVNTGRANALVAEALNAGRLPELGGYEDVRREVAIPEGLGRFDFRLRSARQTCWVEVKSLTLCGPAGRGAFPDAISARALKHVKALESRRASGDRAVLLFCVQHTGVRFATAADEVHPDYGAALRRAVDRGVEVLAHGCLIRRDEISLSGALPVRL